MNVALSWIYKSINTIKLYHATHLLYVYVHVLLSRYDWNIVMSMSFDLVRCGDFRKVHEPKLYSGLSWYEDIEAKAAHNFGESQNAAEWFELIISGAKH